jgi:hypothetical protein
MGVGLGIVLAALIIMPKAPTEAFTTVVGQDRTALNREKAGTLDKGAPGASALGDGAKPKEPTDPSA